MKNDSTPKSFFQLSEDEQKKIIDKSADRANEMQRNSTPSEGWRGKVEAILNQLWIIDDNGNAIPADGISLFADEVMDLIAKARQEVMMTELVHCEEAIERAR